MDTIIDPQLTNIFKANTMLPEDGKIRFREILRHLRGDAPQEQFSKRMGIGQSTLSNWENLTIDNPKLDHLERIATAAGMRVDEFIGFLYYGAKKPKLTSNFDMSELSLPELIELQGTLMEEIKNRL